MTKTSQASEAKPEPKTGTDQKPLKGRASSIRLNEAGKPESPAYIARPEVLKEEGNRTSTIRRPCDLNNDDGDAGAASRNSQESPHPQNNAALELISSVTGDDEEGRSRQRVLVYAARRYASAVERNPEDYDALYNWALVLQESADNVSPDSTSPSKDSLLEEACKKYEESTRLCPTFHDVCMHGCLAFYNWAIAISDRAKMRGRTKEAEELWEQESKKPWELVIDCGFMVYIAFQNLVQKHIIVMFLQATEKYEKAVKLNWNSPQALNNWGLALQELSSIVPAREKQNIVRAAISKVRKSLEKQKCLDAYRNRQQSKVANSVLTIPFTTNAVSHCNTVAIRFPSSYIQPWNCFVADDTTRTAGSTNPKEVSSNELYSQSAIYITAAHALKPNYSVYSSALKLVRSMLPLPHLKNGYLTAPPIGNTAAPHCDWKRTEFFLDHEALRQQATKVEEKQVSRSLSGRIAEAANEEKTSIRVDIPDIVSVSACSDLTLPPGAGLYIDSTHGPVFLVADSWESLDGWLDAIRLVYTIYARGKTDVVAGIITG
ncbi:hypothetical protein GQ457_12G000540 [Hibiscus cannabinus]